MKNKKNNIKAQDKVLFSNTIFLYILTFSSQFFSFLTVPYLTRVLGPSVYGKVGIAVAYMAYVQIILDFGFILSATQKVVENREDKDKLGKIITGVTCVKLTLSIILTIAFGCFVSVSESMKQDAIFYLIYMVSTVANALMPDFFYRGIEKMKIITVRTFIIKGVATLGTFIFVKEATDYWMIPLFVMLGNSVAVFVMFRDMAQNYQVKFQRMNFRFIKNLVKDSALFFVSRAASTAYQAVNTIILSFVYGSSPLVGYYTSADKLISLGKTASSPIADSLYPYMIKQKNYRLVKKILLIFMPIITIGVTVVFVLAEPICIWLFGAEYAEAGDVLRCLLPILWVILPTYILCFPVMVPLGLSKWANMSNVVGMIIQILGLVVLIILGKLSIYTLCLLSSTTEVLVFLFRLIVVIFHKRFAEVKETRS
ncbi:oligosaccharide flippase family protein [Faecalimonas umbilicata]|uniref:oligosaccharide flippase family protein n=1 Tax=Faecalimonas umbilicata TaxID=1912855 RepID=UPI0022DEA0F5|nr:oligosaccharide flippase family protein [Faecalimonas umbilicata]